MADGLTCKDINECEEDEQHSCQHYCINFPGSYECGCKDGFRRMGKNCIGTYTKSICT
jgi:hypothetical protein